APAPPADLDLHAVGEGAVAGGQRAHQTAIAGRTPDLHGLLDVGEADAAVELGELVAEAAGRPIERTMRMLPLAGRGPQLDAKPLAEPAGEPDMVRVIMRDDDARHRRAELVREDVLPEAFDDVAGNARVDDGPTRAVLDQPQIDMIEREGQRHAQPAHTRRDLAAASGRRRLPPGE